MGLKPYEIGFEQREWPSNAMAAAKLEEDAILCWLKITYILHGNAKDSSHHPLKTVMILLSW